MSERQNQSEQTETERYAKRKLRDIARDLESAQGTATVPQLVEEIEKAGAELAYLKTEIEEEA
jgi:plasmid stabilization system protein ParE